MSRTAVPTKKPHFHIHWTQKNRMDWERFDSPHIARARALELASPGETFTIEKCVETFPLCGTNALSAERTKSSLSSANVRILVGPADDGLGSEVDCEDFVNGLLGYAFEFGQRGVHSTNTGSPPDRTVWKSFKDIKFVFHGLYPFLTAGLIQKAKTFAWNATGLGCSSGNVTKIAPIGIPNCSIWNTL